MRDILFVLSAVLCFEKIVLTKKRKTSGPKHPDVPKPSAHVYTRFTHELFLPADRVLEQHKRLLFVPLLHAHLHKHTLTPLMRETAHTHTDKNRPDT